VTNEKKKADLLLSMAEAAQRYAANMDITTRREFTKAHMAASRFGCTDAELNAAIKQGTVS